VSSLEEAAQRVQRGDASAFRAIVEATASRLVRFSSRIMGSVTEAEDVVQEAYVKAYRALVEGQFDARSSVTTWLHRIVVNASLDARRKRKHDAKDDLRDAIAPVQNATAEETIALRELASWLDELPDDQRAALVLKSVEGMASSEIAAVLGCSEGAVEQRLVRARATLRERRDGRKGAS
jgi:RNA polymerase sigma-70 factor, ECF subfamily